MRSYCGLSRRWTRFLAALPVVLFAGCAGPPPEFSDTITTIGTKTNSKFTGIALGVISTANTEKSKEYLKKAEQEAQSGMRWALSLGQFTNAVNAMFSSRFKSVVDVASEEEARERNIDLVMVLDAKVAVGTVSFTTTSVELLGVFKALDGSEISRVSAKAEKMVPYPNFSHNFGPTVTAAVQSFAKNLDADAVLASEAERLVADRKRLERTRVAAAPAAPQKSFPERPLNVRFEHTEPNPKDVAVIIGNADYGKLGTDIPDVVPAYADAEGFRQYLIEALGLREGNIIHLRDATQAQMISVFGTEGNYHGKLFNWVKPGQSNVYVYYSGHGAPGSQSGESYLVPANANASTIELNGYPLKTLYKNLGRIKAKSITVVLEACFSGTSQAGTVISNASPVFLKAKEATVPDNITVVAAGAANQMASWEEDKSHGLFTKYFLLGMSGEADKKPYGNGDGRVSYGELEAYFGDTLTYYARRYYGRDQTPQIVVGKGG